MTDADGARRLIAIDQGLKICDLPFGLLHSDVAVAHGDSSRVITAILKPLETVDKYRTSLLWPYVTHDPAHARSPFVQ
jgi:hypothetical protein